MCWTNRSLGFELENKFNNNGGPYQRGSLRVFDPFECLAKGSILEAL